jgi:CheY-like chemotaxis protein
MAYTEQPDLILVDLVMPGLSGTETIVQLKGDPVTKQVPIVVLTAESTRENVLAARAVGASQIVAKMDFELDGFLKKILALLGETHPKDSTVPAPMAEAVKRIGLDDPSPPEASSPAPESAPSAAAPKPAAPDPAGSHR